MKRPESAAAGMASSSWRAWFVVVAMLFPVLAIAQVQRPRQEPTASEAVDTNAYTFVEEMPELPGGGGKAAIVARIQNAFRTPLFCGRFPVKSRAIVEFTVTATGEVRNIHILQSIESRVDTAVVRAVQTLPRFTPGCQHGRPVAVQLVLPFSFHWQ